MGLERASRSLKVCLSCKTSIRMNNPPAGLKLRRTIRGGQKNSPALLLAKSCPTKGEREGGQQKVAEFPKSETMLKAPRGLLRLLETRVATAKIRERASERVTEVWKLLAGTCMASGAGDERASEGIRDLCRFYSNF